MKMLLPVVFLCALSSAAAAWPYWPYSSYYYSNLLRASMKGVPMLKGVPMTKGYPMVKGVPMLKGYPMVKGVPMLKGYPMVKGVPMTKGYPLVKGVPMTKGILPVTSKGMLYYSPSVCTMVKTAGPCTNFDAKYYYSVVMKRCMMFLYGGCYGNGNKFETKEECEATCPVQPASVCERPQEKGPCFLSLPRWFYNKESESCEMFLYGGCMSNGNKFSTKDACYEACGKKGDDGGAIEEEAVEDTN